MEWLALGFAIIAVVLARWVYQYFFSPMSRFWRLVAAYPDIALSVFRGHSLCVVDTTPANGSKFTGPFSFMDTKGVVHEIYLPYENIGGIQARCADDILNMAAVLAAANQRQALRKGTDP